MELETTLAKNIRIADEKAKYDEACKWYYVKKKYKLNVNFSKTSVLKLS